MGVEFEENTIAPRSFNEPTPKMTQWIIDHKLAKDVKSANRLMVIVAIVCFALALYFIL